MIFPTTGTTISQLVRRCGPAAKLLTQLGIDWRQHRHTTLAEAAEHAGLDARSVLEVMLAADVPRRPPTSRDWRAAPLDELADHVVATHHTYLRQALPRIRLLIDKAMRDHGSEHPELHSLRTVFDDFQGEMERYLVVEEEVLFPMIRQLAVAQRHPGAFGGPIDRSVSDVEQEYRNGERAIEQLERLTRELQASPDASAAYRALIEELRQVHRDLRHHEYLEEKVLFPRAIQIENELKEESS